MVVINFSAQPAQARIHLDADGDPPAGSFRFADLLTAGVYLRDGAEVADLGLYVDLQPWESYLFAVDRVPSDQRIVGQPLKVRKSVAADPSVAARNLEQVDK